MTNKKCLVFETLGKVSDMQLIKESADGLMRLQGVFGVCGVKNNNNRIYDKKNYGMMVEAMQNEIAGGNSVLGELEHPNSMNITLENVSHKIESIQMNEDGTITGTVVLLNTPKGKIAQAIAEASGSLYISSRGAGSIDESGHVTLSTIKTYDLVGTPGFSQAKLNLKKGQKFESLCESVEDGFISVIFESDDLLATDDDTKDKKDEPAKKETETKEPKENDSDKNDDSKGDDNKNKDNEDPTMKDLKEAIDALTEKVTNLEAELHIAKEELDSSKENVNAIKESVDAIVPVNYDAIQQWVTEEFAPEFKENIEESVSDSIDEIHEAVDQKVNEAVESIAAGVQNWVCEEFAPEVQNWVCEEFAPEVQNWVCEEFAPTIENWINEELMPTVDSWINEEFAPEHKANIIKEVNENVNDFFEAKQQDKLTDIDNLLEAIDNSSANVNDQIVETLKQSHTSRFQGLVVVENMPAEYKPSWEMLDEARQNEIVAISRAYDFTKDGVLENFWANVDFGKKDTKINENKTITSDYHNNVIARMMALRK